MISNMHYKSASCSSQYPFGDYHWFPDLSKILLGDESELIQFFDSLKHANFLVSFWNENLITCEANTLQKDTCTNQ